MPILLRGTSGVGSTFRVLHWSYSVKLPYFTVGRKMIWPTIITIAMIDDELQRTHLSVESVAVFNSVLLAFATAENNRRRCCV